MFSICSKAPLVRPPPTSQKQTGDVPQDRGPASSDWLRSQFLRKVGNCSERCNGEKNWPNYLIVIWQSLKEAAECNNSFSFFFFFSFSLSSFLRSFNFINDRTTSRVSGSNIAVIKELRVNNGELVGIWLIVILADINAMEFSFQKSR